MTQNILYGTEKDESKTAELLELYEAMKACPKESYRKLMEQKKSSVFLYHLAAMRSHLLEWYPFQEDMRILEIGGGAGALTDLLLQKGAYVDVIEPCELLAKCNAIRQEGEEKVQIFAGYFECAATEWDAMQEAKYDVIVMAGSLTDASYLMGRAATQAEVLQIVCRYLKPAGKLLLAMENRMGLKYWAGCKDEATGTYFGGIEGMKDQTGASGRTKKELTVLLSNAGYTDLQFYYPYPDHVFPTVIYSDEYLPKAGELRWNLRNYDSDRYQLFDERKVYDTLLEENCYPMYANSYLVIAAKGRN